MVCLLRWADRTRLATANGNKRKHCLLMSVSRASNHEFPTTLAGN